MEAAGTAGLEGWAAGLETLFVVAAAAAFVSAAAAVWLPCKKREKAGGQG